jgi:hypothetical protein
MAAVAAARSRSGGATSARIISANVTTSDEQSRVFSSETANDAGTDIFLSARLKKVRLTHSQMGTGRSFSQRMKSSLGGSPPNARSLVAH